MTDVDGAASPAFVRALHESTVVADHIREATADSPPKLVMLALSDLLQERLTRVVTPDLQVADRIREAIANAPPKLMMLALSTSSGHAVANAYSLYVP